MASSTALLRFPSPPFFRTQRLGTKTSRGRRPSDLSFRSLAKSRSTEETPSSSGSENAVLKVAWYGSELLGVAASLFRRGPVEEEKEVLSEAIDDGTVVVERHRVADAIKEDFQRSYFVTGNLTLNAYEEDCEFADPAGSFKGVRRFKRNCTNFGSLIVKSNMKLTKWEDHANKGVGRWKFSCVMSFPWRPILSATGYTDYYFDSNSGKVCRHVEHWNVPKMALFKQLLRPSRWIWGKQSN